MHESQQPQTEAFEPSAIEREAIEYEKHHYKNPRVASIGALKIIQKRHGWASDGAIYAITDALGIPASDVGGVATFYSQTLHQLIDRHVIRYCDNVVCRINGYQGIQAVLERELSIKPGQTAFDDRFTLLPTCYLRNCDKGSNMMIDEDTHTRLTPKGIPELLERYK